MSVWQKQKNWWNEVLWKPKKALSLDQLKFQYTMLLKNPVITENNKQSLVETFRSIAEILIWGDQNDSRVFDFFLEKNMQSYFLKTLTQKCGRYMCVQLLQTLNILFENIRNETSIYYLLSNNHVNSIIVLRLDFSDEEILAYYISFLKTLSFHLNKHTIHFFYNEHLRDFPLYTEAIKFFKHSESMVRIAVRTLTLNVFKVNDATTLEYICNKTAVPYFSNLVWFIGNHVIDLDECLISQTHHLNRGRLEQLVAEHLDHLHYISDIFSLEIQCLNDILSDHFLNRLLIPLYIYSLADDKVGNCEEKGPRISSTVALFLLSQVFLILSHPSVITPLAYLIFTGDTSLTLPHVLQQDHKRCNSYNSVCAFVQPETSLETSLVMQSSIAHANPISMQKGNGGRGKVNSTGSSVTSAASVEGYVEAVIDDQYVVIEPSPSGSGSSSHSEVSHPTSPSPTSPNRTRSNREKTGVSPSSSKKKTSKLSTETAHSMHHGIPIVNSQFLNSLMGALVIYNDDSRCLFALSMLYAMIKNKGIHHRLLEAFSLKPRAKEQGSPHYYNSELVALLLSTLDSCTSASNCIRLVTLRLAVMLLLELLEGEKPDASKTDHGAMKSPSPVLQDHHIALIENIYESAILRLRLYYRGPNDEIFLDFFEKEYENEMSFKLNVPYLMMDASMLLPPTDTPLTGVDFTRRLPCGEHERARKAMRVFFAMRKLSQQISGTPEVELPLTMSKNSYKMGDTMNISDCDLVSCKVTVGEKTTEHFMVFTETEFFLVDPHKSKPGHGIIHFVCFLQDIDVSSDPADVHALYIIVYHRNSTQKRPSLSGRFVFEDHIRCSAAKSVLQRAQDTLHHSKMTQITRMLHLPVPDNPLAVPVSPQQQQQQQNYLNLKDTTPPSIVSITPTITEVNRTPPTNIPSASSHPFSHKEISSSTVHKVFSSPSPLDRPTTSQKIEMSALTVTDYTGHSIMLGDPPPLNSPVKLTLPMPPERFESLGAEGRSSGEEHEDMIRDMSPTPEPSHLEGLSPGGGPQDEEALTASGGLFRYPVDAVDTSETALQYESETALNLIHQESGSHNSSRYDEDMEGRVCPLGVELEINGESDNSSRVRLDFSREVAGYNDDETTELFSKRDGGQVASERIQEYEATEHAHERKVTEHAQEYEATEHAHEGKVTEHAQEYEATEHAHEGKATEHAHEDEATENAHDGKVTEHAQDSEEKVTTAEDLHCKKVEVGIEDLLTSELAGSLKITEHGHVSSDSQGSEFDPFVQRGDLFMTSECIQFVGDERAQNLISNKFMADKQQTETLAAVDVITSESTNILEPASNSDTLAVAVVTSDNNNLLESNSDFHDTTTGTVVKEKVSPSNRLGSSSEPDIRITTVPGDGEVP